MAGLLKQLQRNKTREPQEDRRAVVRSSTADADSGQLDGDALLSDDSLFQEALDNARPTEPSSAPTHRPPRGATLNTSLKKLAPDLESTPWWLTEERVSNPQVESVVAAAVRSIDLARLAGAEEAAWERAIQESLIRATDALKDEIRVSRKLLEQAENELYALLRGKGPLEPLFEDESVSAVFVDRHDTVRAVRNGHAIETPFRFCSAETYRLFLQALLVSAGAADLSHKTVIDLVLQDRWASRMNVLSATANEEARMCFRIPRNQPISFFDVLQTKTLPATVAAWLAELVALGEANILVAGPKNSGKTVLLTALVSAVGSDERIAVVEEFPEVFTPHTHLERLSPRRSENLTASDLIRTAYNRAPHRLVVGDVNLETAPEFLSALESGYAGSFGVILAESPADAAWRFADLAAAQLKGPFESTMRRVSRAVQLILTVKRIEGAPCLFDMSEMEGCSETEFHVRSLVRFSGVVNGKRQWRLQTRQSRLFTRLREQGLNLIPGPGLLAPDDQTQVVTKSENGEGES